MNATKIIFKAILSLSLKKLWRLFLLVGGHPWFTILSTFATIKAFSIAQRLYPESSSNNGPGNAFRHAFWCCLILMYCCKISSPRKALDWCKKMTDMHEELFPNLPDEKTMDLHNNMVGISLFQEMLQDIHRQFFETSFFIEKLQKMMENAEVMSEENLKSPQQLVYLRS